MTHLALVGPTASGKSKLAIEIARHFGDVEIVSCDSMQVYRGLDIGTAKATVVERDQIPHHMIDLADPSDDWSVAQFQKQARRSVEEIEERGNRALLVGGTGLYFQAVVDDLRIPGEDPDVRGELESRTMRPGGVAEAYAELQSVDPVAAERIDEHNARRIVRALEVIRVTGEPFSSFGPGVDSYGPTAFPVTIGGVWLPRATVSDRIDARLHTMSESGLVDEVAQLRPTLGRNASQAIGYREVIQFLDDEIPTLDEALAQAARRTRSFARRQRMWFRRDPRIMWFGAPRNPDALLPAILAAWS